MKRFLLVLLTLGSLPLFANAWKSELYLLGGTSRVGLKDRNMFGWNLGIRTSPELKFIYFNAGLGLYHYKGREVLRYTTLFPIISDDYVTELAIGTGFYYRAKGVTFKAGSDIGYQISLSGVDNYVSLTPQISLTFKVLQVTDVGILIKYNTALSSYGAYAPKFLGAGLLVRL